MNTEIVEKSDSTKNLSNPDNNLDTPNPLVQFALRVAVIAVGIIIVISSIIDSIKPDQSELRIKFNHVMENHLTRLRLNGLFSTNPYVNWEISIDQEKQDKLPNAIDEMIIAIGILEKANARNEIIEPYKIRLATLKNQLESKNSTSSPADNK